MKTLVIAEKPSLAKAIAGYLSKKHNLQLKNSSVKSGKYSISNIEVGQYIVTSLVGHVMNNAPPEAYDKDLAGNWRESAHKLPVIPSRWKLVVKNPDIVKNIDRLLDDVDRVLHAGDPDQEGQLLVDEVLIHLGNKKPVDRLWLNAIDDVSIDRAFANIKPNKDFIGYYESALSRSHADWLYGINLTRLASVNGNGKFKRDKLGPINIGRVQTPTLALVVSRELEIRNFKPKDFYVPFIEMGGAHPFRANWRKSPADEDYLDPEGRLIDKEHAERIVSRAKSIARSKVVSFVEKDVREFPPMPYSLSDLQADMDRRFGLGAKETLDLTQSLYEMKLVSYPRVDCQYIPESQFSEAPRILGCISAIGQGFSAAVKGATPSLKSKAWNDAKTTAHHAIIPRPFLRSDIDKLDSKQRLLFEAICQRYVLQFYRPATAKESEMVLAVEKDEYVAKGKRYIDRSWKDAFKTDKNNDDNEAILPRANKGDVFPIVNAAMEVKTTTAPKRFTQGTLITAMKNIHAYADKDDKDILKEVVGIGTEATRANILKELIEREYIIQKKNVLIPSEFAISLIAALPKEMTSPEITADWQRRMKQIIERKYTYREFMSRTEDWIKKLSVDVANRFKKLPSVSFDSNGSNRPLKITDKNGVVRKEGDDCPKCANAKLQARTVVKEGPNKGVRFLVCGAGRDVCDFIVFPPLRSARKSARSAKMASWRAKF